jgi:D-alanyl-lipoteichoic acid acyltransferase DltB (MBOAT superfamily)
MPFNSIEFVLFLFAALADLLVTMILGGLWHGAAWNFVAWGCGRARRPSAHLPSR